MAHSVVIGGAGFVGSWVVDEILKDPYNRVTIIDNLISSEKWNISTDPRVRFIEGSAADSSTFDKINGQVDFLYQLACFHGNQSSIARPIDDLENGLKTTLVSLEWVKNNSPRTRLIYSGAGCAIAEKTWDTPIPVTEKDMTSLKHDSPYSISKVAGEMYCNFYFHFHNLEILRLRFQNVYGPREILGAGLWRGTEHTIWRNVIPTFIWKALNNQDLTLYGEAESSRDFIYVEDLAKACVLVAQRGQVGQVYNLGSGKEVLISDLAREIITITDSSSKIRFVGKRSWDNSGRRLADVSKAQFALDFKASTTLKQGLSETTQWFMDNYKNISRTIIKHSK